MFVFWTVRSSVKSNSTHFKCLFCTDLTVIDMMVDPDGNLDALSNLGLTSPLTEQKIGPGNQQGASLLLPGAGASSTASRLEGRAAEFSRPLDQSEVAERGPGPQQSPKSYNWYS